MRGSLSRVRHRIASVRVVMRWIALGPSAVSDTARRVSGLRWGVFPAALREAGPLGRVQREVDEGESGLVLTHVLQAVHHACTQTE